MSKGFDNITQTELLSRVGWSKSLVEKLLGEPDLRKKFYGRSVPACLYNLDRVVAAEQSPAFVAAQAGLAKRKASAAKAVKTKTENLLADIAKMSVSVAVIGMAQLRKMAIDAYNDWNWESDMPATTKSDPEFLSRITVNFIRHQLTEYDQALWEIAGKTGKSDAVKAIRAKVFGAIAAAYPSLKGECERQMSTDTSQQMARYWTR